MEIDAEKAMKPSTKIEKIAREIWRGLSSASLFILDDQLLRRYIILYHTAHRRESCTPQPLGR